MGTNFRFDPDKVYDLFGVTDYSAEGDPVLALHGQPRYRIKFRHFMEHAKRWPNGEWPADAVTGKVVLAGAGASGWPVECNGKRLGVIGSDGFYVTEGGDRFQVMEVEMNGI